MGRQAHLLRLALGRSADLPPDWEAVSDQYERIEGDGTTPPHYLCIDSSNRLSYGKTFDEKGRPMDLRVYQLDEERCKAQNDVLALGVTQDNQQGTEDDHVGPNSMLSDSSLREDVVLQWATEGVLEPVFRYLRYSMVYPILILRRRLMVFSLSESMSLVDYVSSGTQAQGFLSFTFAGYPSALLEIMIEMFMKDPSSRLWKDTNITHKGPRTLILLADIFVMLPLSIFAKVQQLHLLPANKLFPPLATFAPWSASSPLVTRNRSNWWHASAATSVFIYNRLTDKVFYLLGSALLSCTWKPPVEDTDQSTDGIIRRQFSRVGYTMLRTLGWSQDTEPFATDYFSAVPVLGVPRVLSRICGQLLLLPAQAIMYRIVAYSFLDHASTPSQQANAAFFRTRMFPILGPSLKNFTTLQGMRGIGRYVTNIALCTGVYIAVELLQQVVQNAVAILLLKRSRRQSQRRQID